MPSNSAPPHTYLYFIDKIQLYFIQQCHPISLAAASPPQPKKFHVKRQLWLVFHNGASRPNIYTRLLFDEKTICVPASGVTRHDKKPSRFIKATDKQLLPRRRETRQVTPLFSTLLTQPQIWSPKSSI